MKMSIFWNMKQCGPLKANGSFGEKYTVSFFRVVLPPARPIFFGCENDGQYIPPTHPLTSS
jgi:hypothetical protein